MIRRRVFGLLGAALVAVMATDVPARGQAPTDTLFIFHLSGDQVVPPNGTTERGGCLVAFDAVTSTATITCVHNVTGPTSIDIYRAPAGGNGPLVFSLGAPASPVQVVWAGMTPAQTADLLAGNLYIDIDNGAFPGGAIRGQILPRTVDTVNFTLNGTEPVPPTLSTASGNCSANLSNPGTSVDIQCTHNVPAPQTADVHQSPPGANGPAFFTFPSAASPFSASVPLNREQIAAFAAGFLYVDIHTADFPGGEIRGQIGPVPPSVPTTGTIRITKTTNPAGGSGFTFTDNIPGSAGTFTLAHGESRTFADVAPGAYTVTENNPLTTPGSYVLNGLTCDDADSAGNVATRTASIQLQAGELVTCTFENVPATAPSFSKAFAPAAISTAEVSTLTFTIQNNAAVAATSLAFTDTLPAGLVVAATPNASTTCAGGTLSAAAGGGTISYSNGSVPANATCTVRVDVSAGSAGTYNNVSGALTSSQGSGGTASASLLVTRRTFTVASATGSGSITGAITGGGASCTIASVTPTTAAAVAGGPPPGVTFPHGLLDFRLEACTPGSTVTFAITFPATLEDGTQYWKFGPRSIVPSPTWYEIPATIAGATVTYSVTDGGLGDDDLAANGTIDDPGGPGVGMAVPAMPLWMLMLLALLLLLAGRVATRRLPGIA